MSLTKTSSLLKYIFLVGYFLFLSTSFGKVEPPNYDFSLDALKPFFPGGTLEEMKKLHGKGEVFDKRSSPPIYKFNVAHVRYKFPVFVQIQKGKSVDFFARLPSYFLHDVFHQSLINRYGMQNSYYKKFNQALYYWRTKEGVSLTYSGTCTITCFPIYLTGSGGKGSFTPLLEKFSTIPKDETK